jgi:hypothetical protein
MLNEKKRIDKLDNIVRILANINIPYWKDKSKRDSKKYNKGVASMMTTLTNSGALDADDPIYQISNLPNPQKRTTRGQKDDQGDAFASMNKALRLAKDVANRIHTLEQEGERADQNELDKLYLKAFDFINMWGGPSIRFHYGNRDVQEVINDYKQGALAILINADVNAALQHFKDIDGIDMSYATKHLWFWTEVAKDLNIMQQREPVFDDRISRALLGILTAGGPDGEERRDSANSIWDKIVEFNNKTKNTQYDKKDIEEAVFNFLGHYFKSNLGDPRSMTSDEYGRNWTTRSENYKEAKALSNLRTGNYDVPGGNNQGDDDEDQNDAPLGGAPVQPREKTPEEIAADEERIENNRKQAAENKLQADATEYYQSRWNANMAIARKEIIPQELRDELKKGNNKKFNKFVTQNNDKLTARAQELTNKDKEEYINRRREEENQINETWNKWAKWATK